MAALTPYLPIWAIYLVLIFAGLFCGLLAARLIMWAADMAVARGGKLLAHVHTRRLSLPLHVVVPAVGIFAALRIGVPTIDSDPVFVGAVNVTIVALVYWLLLRLVEIVAAAVTRRYDITVKDNLKARQVRTQISVVRSIVTVALFLACLVTVFMMFDTLRGLGVSLLASAGVAGLAIGFAAQKTLGNLLAGVQIALTQPIRLEDAIVVEGEWGWVEEITLTYVVVRLWDLRRLILPIAYFIEHPFQNWTRQSAAIIGTVELFADFRLPLDPVREELTRLLSATTLWDGKTQVVQVTDVSEQTMKVRILVSAVDSPTAFDLRCYVREHLIEFISRAYPDFWPQRRVTPLGLLNADLPDQRRVADGG